MGDSSSSSSTSPSTTSSWGHNKSLDGLTQPGERGESQNKAAESEFLIQKTLSSPCDPFSYLFLIITLRLDFCTFYHKLNLEYVKSLCISVLACVNTFST